ncbi:MAG: hypothetical protein AAGA56_15480, partial [Myxococcota bacterium]
PFRVAEEQTSFRVEGTGSLRLGEGRRAVASPVALYGEGEVRWSVEGAEESLAISIADDDKLTVHALYGSTGVHTVRVTGRDRAGATDTYELEVRVDPLAWRGRKTWTIEGPEAREHGSWIPTANGACLLGGSGYAPYLAPLDDAWWFQPDTGLWSRMAVTGDPLPAGGSRRVAGQQGRGEAYLFGGYGEGNAVDNELHRVTLEGGGVVVEAVEQLNPPPPRSLHGFAFDPETERYVVFGGLGGDLVARPLGDTWIMELVDGVAQWTEVDTNRGPSPRYGFFYGIDEATGRFYLFSGAQGTGTIDPARDTWMLDLRAAAPAWELLSEGERNPPGRRNGVSVFDPTGPRLFVFGGTADGMTTEPGLWAFDVPRRAWTELALEGEPPLRSSGFGFFDSTTQSVHLGFGNSANAAYQDITELASIMLR